LSIPYGAQFYGRRSVFLLPRVQRKILKGMLKAKLPRREIMRNPNQFGDLSLATALKKHNKGSRINASIMNTIE